MSKKNVRHTIIRDDNGDVTGYELYAFGRLVGTANRVGNGFRFTQLDGVLLEKIEYEETMLKLKIAIERAVKFRH